MKNDHEEGRTDKYSRVIVFVGIQISLLFMNYNSLEAEPLSIRKLRHSLALVQITFRLGTGDPHTIQMRDLRPQR